MKYSLYIVFGAIEIAQSKPIKRSTNSQKEKENLKPQIYIQHCDLINEFRSI